MGIKHATTGTGTKINDTVWSEDHAIDGATVSDVGDIIPKTDLTYDLGSTTLGFAISTHRFWDIGTQTTGYISYQGTNRISLANLHTTAFGVHPSSGDGHGSLGISAIGWGNIYSYDAVSKTQTTGLSFKWKDASEEALVLTDATSSVAFTDVDLTALTSASAKMAYLTVRMTIDTAAKDYAVGFRKNGTTPTMYPKMSVYGEEAHAADIFQTQMTVGLDSGQIAEYILAVEGGGQCDLLVHVLGYWE